MTGNIPATDKTATEAKKNEPLSPTAQLKAEQNQSILKASLEVSISSGNDSLALLYRTAVDKLNQVLETDLGPNSIQNAYESGLDVSPDATAERIVSQATAFFSSYQDQHPEMDLETQLRSFIDVISGGITQGFNEAREILDGLQVLEGDIATNIDQTYDLVQEKLDSFINSMLETLSETDPENPDTIET